MAVPTIAVVAPNVGATMGGSLVEITGTNFKPWTAPPPTWGPVVPAPSSPTMQVLFGGLPSPEVAVISATRLLALVPATPIIVEEASNYGEGVVAVEVRNLDSSGVPIPGETATMASAYTFRRANLARQSDLNRLCRQIIVDWNAQVLSNVSMTTHTDFDPETGDLQNTAGIAKLPGIALLGPELRENRMYSTNVHLRTPLTGIERAIRRVPFTVDVSFTILGAARLHAEAINLAAAVVGYFERNKYVALLRDPADASKGFVQYPLEFERGNEPKLDPTPSDSNVHFFSARMVIRGFDVEHLTGFVDHQVVGRTGQVTEDPGILGVHCPEEDEL